MPSCGDAQLCVSSGSHSTPTQPPGFCSRRRTFSRCFLFVFCIIFLSPLPPGKSSSRVVCRVLSKFAKPFLVYRGLICSESLVGMPISHSISSNGEGGSLSTPFGVLEGPLFHPLTPFAALRYYFFSTCILFFRNHSLLFANSGIIFFLPVFFFFPTHSLIFNFFLCYVLLDGKVHVPTCYCNPKMM